MSILRLVEYEHRRLESLQASISHFSSEAVATATEKLRASGYIERKWGRFSITRKGKDVLPTRVAPISMQGQYRPPRVVRRPGSDHSHLPSMRGGKRYYPWRKDREQESVR